MAAASCSPQSNFKHVDFSLEQFSFEIDNSGSTDNDQYRKSLALLLQQFSMLPQHFHAVLWNTTASKVILNKDIIKSELNSNGGTNPNSFVAEIHGEKNLIIITDGEIDANTMRQFEENLRQNYQTISFDFIMFCIISTTPNILDNFNIGAPLAQFSHNFVIITVNNEAIKQEYHKGSTSSFCNKGTFDFGSVTKPAEEKPDEFTFFNSLSKQWDEINYSKIIKAIESGEINTSSKDFEQLIEAIRKVVIVSLSKYQTDFNKFIQFLCDFENKEIKQQDIDELSKECERDIPIKVKLGFIRKLYETSRQLSQKWKKFLVESIFTTEAVINLATLRGDMKGNALKVKQTSNYELMAPFIKWLKTGTCSINESCEANILLPLIPLPPNYFGDLLKLKNVPQPNFNILTRILLSGVIPNWILSDIKVSQDTCDHWGAIHETGNKYTCEGKLVGIGSKNIFVPAPQIVDSEKFSPLQKYYYSLTQQQKEEEDQNQKFRMMLRDMITFLMGDRKSEYSPLLGNIFLAFVFFESAKPNMKEHIEFMKNTLQVILYQQYPNTLFVIWSKRLETPFEKRTFDEYLETLMFAILYGSDIQKIGAIISMLNIKLNEKISLLPNEHTITKGIKQKKIILLKQIEEDKSEIVKNQTYLDNQPVATKFDIYVGAITTNPTNILIGEEPSTIKTIILFNNNSAKLDTLADTPLQKALFTSKVNRNPVLWQGYLSEEKKELYRKVVKPSIYNKYIISSLISHIINSKGQTLKFERVSTIVTNFINSNSLYILKNTTSEKIIQEQIIALKTKEAETVLKLETEEASRQETIKNLKQINSAQIIEPLAKAQKLTDLFGFICPSLPIAFAERCNIELNSKMFEIIKRQIIELAEQYLEGHTVGFTEANYKQLIY